MATEEETASAGELLGRRSRDERPLMTRMISSVANFSRKKPLGAIGGFIILLMVLLAVFAPIIANDPMEWNLRDKFQSPSFEYWLGTNDVGQDLWAQIVYGAQISLYVGILSVAYGSGIGGVVGLVSAFYGGKTDVIIQRIMDAMMAIPTLVLALAIMAALGGSVNNVVIAIGAVQIPRANRIVRSQALAVRESEYALAARSIGATDMRIMFQHIMPQCVAPWLIIATAALGTAIISEASLSFLGMGVPPTTPTWGGMLSQRGREYFVLAPQMQYSRVLRSLLRYMGLTYLVMLLEMF